MCASEPSKARLQKCKDDCFAANDNGMDILVLMDCCSAKCSGIDSVKKWCPNLKA